MNPDVIYAVYNDPEFETNYQALKDCATYVTPIPLCWEKYISFVDFAQEIFIEHDMLLTFSEFRDIIRNIWETTVGTIILNEVPGMTSEMVDKFFKGESIESYTSKNSIFWKTVPTRLCSFRNHEHYNHYKTRNNSHQYWDYEKYYKIRGLAIKEEQWKEKFKDYKKIEERYFYKYVNNFVIPDNIMNSLEEAFLQSGPKIFWPLMTNIISDPEIREDSSYPLLAVSDLLKIEYLTSFVLDNEIEKKILLTFSQQFMKYTADDIKQWRKHIEMTNKHYKTILEKIERIKHSNV